MVHMPRTAARPLAARSEGVYELFVEGDAVDLCLLVNRRARTMRVVDFRAGPSPEKRNVVVSMAEREGVAKAFVLVERDELQTWLRLGFAREGTLPAFYKRSDAFLLGCTVAPRGAIAGHRAVAPPPAEAPLPGEEGAPLESETRLIAAPPADAAPAQARQATMERTIGAAKRVLVELRQRSLPRVKVAPMREADARRAVAAAVRKGRALTGFEPFGRDVVRRYLTLTARGGFELVASIESQACFGNALLELLQGPGAEGAESEIAATTAAMRDVCALLAAEGALCCFALLPSDDVGLAVAFLHCGFRRTGLMADQLLVGRRRKDAIVWSRKLVASADG